MIVETCDSVVGCLCRGAFGPDTPRVGERYAEDVADIIRSATSGRIAGFISETVQVGKRQCSAVSPTPCTPLTLRAAA
jgi:hypothetical protein